MTTILDKFSPLASDWALNGQTLALTPPTDYRQVQLFLYEVADLLYTYSDYVQIVSEPNDDVDSGQIGITLKPGSSWSDLDKVMNAF